MVFLVSFAMINFLSKMMFLPEKSSNKQLKKVKVSMMNALKKLFELNTSVHVSLYQYLSTSGK
jgi:regulatory protein YycI of two-component signal transduction system YycFG